MLRRRGLRSHALFTALAVMALAASPAMRADDRPSFGGLAPRADKGMLVSIPGCPLPAMSPDSVRGGILLFRPVLAGLRLVGRTAVLARGIGFMATLHAAIGEEAEADRLFDEAQKIFEERGVTGRDLGWLNNNHGLVRLDQHRPTEALHCFLGAVTSLGEDTPEILEARAKVEQNIGMAYELLGDPDNSESHFWKALDTVRQLGREDDPDFDVIRVNLAELYSSVKDLSAARKILEPLAADGHLHGETKFAVLNNLGYVLYAMDDTRGAESVLKRALVLTRPRSQGRLLVHANLAATYLTANDFEGARREGEEALRLARQLYGDTSTYAAGAMGTLATTALARGDLEEADHLLTRAVAILVQDKAAGDATAGLIQEQAIVAQRRGDRRVAEELSRRALAMEKKNLAVILAFGSESQRLAYRSRLYPYDQLANLGNATLIADAVLTTKGAVLESLLLERVQIRRSRSSADRRRLDRIHGLKIELMERVGHGESRLDPLQRELQREETALAHSLKLQRQPTAKPVRLASIQAALQSDEVLIEIIEYLRYDGERRNVPCYGAIVIPRRGGPSWVPLGATAAIDPLVTGLLQRLDVGSRGMEASSAAGDVIPALRELNDHVWNPLARALPAGARRVVLSPDGAMHFIPWPALLDEKARFLVERWQLEQVGSGRDLLRRDVPVDKTLLALADGANDLPSAREEARHLAAMARVDGWRTTLLLGEEAVESALTRTPAPRILHFATHGVQLAGDGPQSVEGRLGRNPMYRGALLLAGARRTLAAWKRGAPLPAADDGILTAEEIAGLDLGRTWLTVLSACRSGAGEASIGEGILGLRRGFALAGTKNLLYSLWSIDDEATTHFMQVFYEHLFASGDPALALNETQAVELRRWTELDHDIPTAVFRAGGFVLSR